MALHLDHETSSDLDINDVGLWKYVTHPSTKVLMTAYAFDDEEPKLWEPRFGSMPDELMGGLLDSFETKTAWNSAFERLIFKFCLGIEIPIYEWRDTQILSRYYSLFSNLDDTGKALGLPEDIAKLAEGSRLIKKFCVPAVLGKEGLFGLSPSQYRDHRTDPEDWELFGEYCKQDVVAERHIEKLLESRGEMPEREWQLFFKDQEVNDRGLPCDMQLVSAANRMAHKEQARLSSELKVLTGLENPNSDQQILKFVQSQGYQFSKIGKGFVQRALKGDEFEITDLCRTVLGLRSQLAKSAVDKFETFDLMMGEDARLHHQFQFMGAARTGRWSARGVQLQNVTRPVKELEDEEVLEEAVQMILAEDLEAIRTRFKSQPLDVIASCTRPVIEASEGNQFIIADLSSIENVVGGWISGCQKILDVFISGRDPYKEFAVHLFGVPYEQVTKEQRALAKAPTLACFYRMAAGDEKITESGDKILTGLRAYAESMGVEMPPAIAEKAVKVFRKEFPEVVKFWKDLENAWIRAVKGETMYVGKCKFQVVDRVMKVTLPSGRSLHYFYPKILEGISVRWGDKEYTKTECSFMGVDSTTHQFTTIVTHGGSLAENLCQSIARDVLTEGIIRAEAKGFFICGHVHDELISETPCDSILSVTDLENCMADPIEWAPSLPLRAAGFCSRRYRKG